MVIHKKTRLTPFQREEIYKSYYEDKKKVTDLADEYHVSRPTIYKILRRGRHKDFTIHKSTNKRFRCLRYGIKRLAKIEAEIEAKLKRQAKRYNKDYPGQMLHGDTKRLPLSVGMRPFYYISHKLRDGQLSDNRIKQSPYCLPGGGDNIPTILRPEGK